MRDADRALYRAKAQGRKRVRVASDSDGESVAGTSLKAHGPEGAGAMASSIAGTQLGAADTRHAATA